MKYSFFSFFVLAIILNGCGGGSRPSEKAVTTNKTTVEVERGAVFNAKIIDAKKNMATEINTTNKYQFDFIPAYPLTALASNDSWIDIDGDGKRTTNDVILDINMTSYEDVVTPVTTVLSDKNNTKRELLAKTLSDDFDIPMGKLYEVPSKANNSNLSILTNVIYIKAKEFNKSIKELFNYNSLIEEKNTTLKNAFENLKTKIENNSAVYINGIIDSSKLEKYLYDTNKSLFTNYKVIDELGKKEVKSTQSIEDIWNIGFKINNKEYKNIKIGIEIVKHNSDGSKSIGQFVYSNVNITKNSATTKLIQMWAITPTRSGGTWIDEKSDENNLLKRSISLNSDKLILNIGTLIKELADKESSFKVKTKYDITIISSAPIFKHSYTMSLSLIDGQVKFIDKEGICGEIIIK